LHIHTHNEWSELQSVVVGTATNANWPSKDIAFQKQKTSWTETPIPSGPVLDKIINETNEDLEELCQTLSAFGVEIFRPKDLNYQKLDTMSGYNPRDRLLVIGNRVFDVNMRFSCRQHEIEAYDFIPNIEPIDDNLAIFDAANVCRIGKDLLYLVSESGTREGGEWLRNTFEGEYNVHILDNIYDGVHIDSTITALNDHTVLLNASRINKDNLPKIFKDWNCIFINDCVPIDFYEYPYASKWLGMNMFSIDSKTVVVDKNQKEIIKILEKNNFTVVPLQLRHARTLGGGFHCVTLDLWREDFING